MTSQSINIRVTGPMQEHVRRQTGEHGLYEDAGEYIRDLIRRDMQTADEAWDLLRRELEPGMIADESEFVEVTAEDVIRRNTRR